MKSPRFLKIMGYETKRIFRNKVVFGMLLIFCIALICTLYFVQSVSRDYVVAVYTDGMEQVTEQDNFKIMQKRINARIVYVNSDDKGINMIKKGEAIFFIRFSKEDDPDMPASAIIYYDGANRVVGGIVEEFKDTRDREAYTGIMEFLSSYGIKVNTAYFQSMRFRQISDRYSDYADIFTYEQLAFGLEIAASIALILMLGIAYSLARDRETSVSKNVSYIPIGHNTYFLSKMVPYFILGMMEMLFLCLIGAWLMNISFQFNLFLVWISSAFFVTATVSMGLLFSMFRNQISSIFLAMMAILLPIFVDIMVVTPALPTYLRVILNFFPVSTFLRFFNGMVFNGIFLWKSIPIFIAQTVGYYLIALLVIKKQAS